MSDQKQDHTLNSIFSSGLSSDSRSQDREAQLVTRTDSLFFELNNTIDGIIWAAAIDGTLDYTNNYFNDYIGSSKLGTKAWCWPELIHPEDLSVVSATIDLAINKQESFEVFCRVLSKDGEYHSFLVRGADARGSHGRMYRWVGSAVRADGATPNLCSDEEAASYVMGMTDAERQALGEPYVSKTNTLTTPERMAKRFQFLAETSELASSLDIQTVLQNLARLTVPRVADWVGVLQLHPEGMLSTIAHFHRDPGLAHLGWVVSIKFPPTEEPQHGSFYTLKTGEAQLMGAVSDEVLWQLGKRADVVKYLKQLGQASTIVAPLKAHGRMVGTVSFGISSSGRQYDESDRLFAQEIAQRLAQAIEHSRLYNESQKINQVKDEFLATLSHELRTPLNVIMGYSELVLNNWTTMARPDIQSSLEAIHRNSRSQLQMVDDLLDISSMILGKVRLSLSQISIAELIHNSVSSLRMMLDSKNISVKIDTHQAPALMTADSERLQQVIMNLLVNAVKYTPAGGHIEVGTEAAPGQITVVVSDSGVGIEPEFLPYVFDRFKQEHSGSTRRFGGLGLGLAIARNLIELHGGTIQAQSGGRGRGSSFRVSLPVQEASAPKLVEDKRLLTDSTSDASPLSGIRILIVEDDPDTRCLVRRFLERAAAEVIEASSAAEGFRLLQMQNCSPALILSDIGMPEEDGISFIRKVRSAEQKQSKFTPAAALTAFTRPEDGERALAAGFQMHIAKPVTRQKLISEVTKLLCHYHSIHRP